MNSSYYIGPPDLHDGKIDRVIEKGDRVAVQIQGANGDYWTIEFFGVTEIRAVKPETMILYALVEQEAATPFRRFVFANWDEDDDASLEILAQDFMVTEDNVLRE